MPRNARRLALLFATALLLPALAPQAHAATTPITTGALDWGVKESFRSYITGPIASGSIDVSGGATQNPGGTFHFPLTGGSYDDETGATVASFAGTVRFRGHDGQLDLTLSDVRVELAADGSRLLADLASVPFPAGGAPASYPDTPLVALELDGAEPTGATTWSAVPATLTPAGAPAFGGFYTAGTAFDPISFSYDGPGGRPIAEPWTEPGSPFFDAVARIGNLGGNYAVLPDAAHGLVHVVSATGVHAFDLDTLEPRAAFEHDELDQFGIAFDPATATVFVRDASNSLLTLRYDGGAYELGEVPMPGARTLDYDPATGKLWAIGTFPVAGTFQGNPTVAVATRDGAGGWTVEDYPPLDTGGRNVRGVARSSTGALIVSYGPLVSGSPPQAQPQASAVVDDTGDALVATDIPGTVAAPPASGLSHGYVNPVAGPDGTIVVGEFAPGAPETRVLTLAPSDANPSGFAPAGAPLRLGPGLGTVAVDGIDGSLYAIGNDALVVHRDGAAVATLPYEGAVRVAGGQSSVYVTSNSTGELARFRQVGSSPEITEQPAGRTVELPSPEATAQVIFTAAATGDPAPEVRWQRRAPGATAWTDVDGATAGTLTVTAGVALAGTRFRAVFESAAGALASDAATLTVRILPPARHDSPRTDPPPGSPPPGGAPPPGPASRAPVWSAARKRATVSAKGVAKLATVRCVTGTCRVSAPKRVRVKIGHRTHRAAVLTPGTLLAGRRGSVRIRLPRAATKALAGRRATVRLKLVARSGEARATQTLRVTLRPGPGTQPGRS